MSDDCCLNLMITSGSCTIELYDDCMYIDIDRGLFDSSSANLDKEQLKVIYEHLKLLFDTK